MSAAWLIPYRPDGGPRERLYAFVRARLEIYLPGVEVVVSDDLGARDDLFNHGEAYNLAAAKTDADLLILGDADTTFLATGRDVALAIVDSSVDRRWRLPRYYHQLTENRTDRFISGEVGSIAEVDVDWTGDSVSVSGIVIVPREAYEQVGGADERYLGWGADDVAMAVSLEVLYGEAVRYPGSAIHLYHPRGDQEKGWHRYSIRERELTERYLGQRGNPIGIAKLCAGKRVGSLPA